MIEIDMEKGVLFLRGGRGAGQPREFNKGMREGGAWGLVPVNHDQRCLWVGGR